MRKMYLLFSLALSANTLLAQENTIPSKQKTLYVTGTAHFDTQWLWTIQTSINEYVPATMKNNFRLFEKYPAYKFSFEGAFKYMLMKEYYPSNYELVKKYVASGNWNICGSSLDAFDVNIPSPFALSRSILLGQNFYRKEFGTVSRDIFLPDCFGFGYALPTIANFCGLKGFSTQKLTWGSSVGVPFDLGVWQGVDGSKIIAALNPGDYNGDIQTDLSNDLGSITTVDNTGKKNYGIYLGYRYFGTGDIGGSPRDTSLYWLDKSVKGNGPLKIVNAAADYLFTQITPTQMGQMPVYNSELLMSTHGTGCYTSQAAMKKWNRKNELLSNTAEKASVMASWIAGEPYPQEKLNAAYTRFLWHEFHDDLTGTSIPEAYNFSWNDELLSLNQFSSVLDNAVGSVAKALDTKTKHIPLVVYNSLSFAREDAVEATVSFPKPVTGIKVYNKEGNEIPSQVIVAHGNSATILFIASVPAMGFEVYEVQQASKQLNYASDLKASLQSIENSQYVLFFDAKTSDVKRILEKSKMRDMLVRPLRLSYFNDTSERWPAWEILYKTIVSPKGYLEKMKSFEIVEDGPVRVSIKQVRERDGSIFTQYIRLYAGKPGERIEFVNEVDWKSKGSLVKAEFSLACPSSRATYDLGMGVIQRGNNTEKLYEVPAQQWADLSLPDGSFGVTIMNDSKYGWDKPNDNTLRLTLLRTPKTGKDYAFQSTNDLGHHKFSYALYGHSLDWRKAKSSCVASAFNQPLIAFQTSSHEGVLGKSFSFASLNTADVIIKSIKKAENSDELVFQFQELIGTRVGNVKLTLPSEVVAAREVNGAEEAIGNGRIENKQLVFDINAFQPKAFAIKLAESPKKLKPAESLALKLDYNLDGISTEANYTDGNIDGKGNTFPAELFPEKLEAEGITFSTGSKADGQKNLLSCTGQSIQLPQGNYNKLYLLAFALKDDKASFTIDGKPSKFEIPYFSGFIGQWDGYNRTSEKFNDSIAKGYLKKALVAWNATHLHSVSGNKAYEFGYLFKLAIDIPKGAKTLQLPNNANIIISAVSIANDANADTKMVGIVEE